MRLSDYITQVGDAKFAKKFRFNQRTVMSWRLGDRVPSRKKARVIVARTPVTYEGIYGEERAA